FGYGKTFAKWLLRDCGQVCSPPPITCARSSPPTGPDSRNCYMKYNFSWRRNVAVSTQASNDPFYENTRIFLSARVADDRLHGQPTAFRCFRYIRSTRSNYFGTGFRTDSRL